MREIKFRGKALSKDLGWLYGDLLHISELPSEVLIGGVQIDQLGKKYQAGTLVDKNTIGQFTGLFDKNGVEIYEGDILKVKVNMRKPVPENERQSQWDTVRLVPSYEKWTVEYCERYSQGNGFYCFGKDRRFNTHITKSKLYNTEAEIIGNIHDNPELLKGE